MAIIPIQEIINKSVRSNAERGKKGISSWHISKLGTCQRGIYLERLGFERDEPLDDRTMRVFDVGNKFEDWLVGLIQNYKGVVKPETQVRVEDKKLNVSGYVDLVLEYEGQKKAYEIKSKHTRSFWYMIDKQQGAMQHHKYQLWTYLYLLGIDDGSIVYLSKDDETIAEFPIKRNDKRLEKEVMDILKTLNFCWKAKTYPPLAEKGTWMARYCGWHKQCLKIEEELKGRGIIKSK